MESASFEVLAKVDWQFWCTLTFGRVRTDRVQQSMFNRWVRDAARMAGVREERLLWIKRVEAGEIGSRLHFHALMAGFPYTDKTVTFAHSLRSLWKRAGGGWSRCYVYDPSLGALAYTHKGKERDAAGKYEAAKFSSPLSIVTWSNAVQRFLASQRRNHEGLHSALIDQHAPERPIEVRR